VSVDPRAQAPERRPNERRPSERKPSERSSDALSEVNRRKIVPGNVSDSTGNSEIVERQCPPGYEAIERRSISAEEDDTVRTGRLKFEITKALVLLDFQNDFVDPSGKLYVNNAANFLRRLSTR
jgi:hypothetical protein